MHLAGCPAEESIAWADAILKDFRTHKAIISVPELTDLIPDHQVFPCGNGAQLWDRLVLPNPNVYLIVAGRGAAVARTEVANGHEVHVLALDLESSHAGASDWLGIMRFASSEDKVHIDAYSPSLGRYRAESGSRFSLNFPLSEFAIIGWSVGVPSGSSASVVWPNLSAGTAYEWVVSAIDDTGRSRIGPVSRFTTGSAVESFPAVINAVEPPPASIGARRGESLPEISSSASAT